jgi:glutamate--cysteine ligase
VSILPSSAADPSAEPLTFDDLVSYFHAGAKPRGRWKVGAEFEKFLLERDTGRAVSHDEPGGVGEVLKSLAERFGWQPMSTGSRLVLLAREGAHVSLEPGGQVEFSTPPLVSLHDIEREFLTHVRELKAVVDPAQRAWPASRRSPGWKTSPPRSAAATAAWPTCCPRGPPPPST